MRSPPALTQQPEPDRDVYRRCQDGADRGAGSDAGLRRGRWFDGEHAAGEVTDAFGNTLAGQTVSVTARQRRSGRSDCHHRAGRHGGDLCHQPDGGDQLQSL
ncbi:hypothetical protein O5623_17365 [Escherichia coli]|nr:hypothetical protein [Escherichia coli]